MGKLEVESCEQQITTVSSNRSPALLDNHLIEIEILEEPKHQLPANLDKTLTMKFNFEEFKGV
uniref:Uncharacterized protein n=1 Tax=Rhizophagus irregularis (strain DAOM 181602 / DAOM 197198 / MUCL 43194) TaxID=747089 RepID=U9U3S2_RHIID